MAAGLIPGYRKLLMETEFLLWRLNVPTYPHTTQVLGIIQARLVARAPGIYTAPPPQHSSLLSQKTQYLTTPTHFKIKFSHTTLALPFLFIYIIFKQIFPHFTRASSISCYLRYLEINFSIVTSEQ